MLNLLLVHTNWHTSPCLRVLIDLWIPERKETKGSEFPPNAQDERVQGRMTTEAK